MRVVIWITEATWERLVTQVGALLPAEAQIALLHVADGNAEEIVSAGPAGLLGRRAHRRGPPPRSISAREAQLVLEAARQRLGRRAELLAARGHVEREVLAGAATADLLVVARDGPPGPRSLARHARFIVDHATCPVLLLGTGDLTPGAPPEGPPEGARPQPPLPSQRP